MAEFGKLIVLLGLVLIVIGGVTWALGRSGFRGLPGDIVYTSGNVRIYFPIVTCILLSILLTLALWAWQWLRGR